MSDRKIIDWYSNDIDWSQIEFGNSYNIKIMKELQPKYRKLVQNILIEYIINDLSYLVIGYILEEMDIEIYADTYDQIIRENSFVDYMLVTNIENQTIQIFYCGLRQYVDYICLNYEHEWININIKKMDENVVFDIVKNHIKKIEYFNILSDIINIFYSHIKYLKDKQILHCYVL